MTDDSSTPTETPESSAGPGAADASYRWVAMGVVVFGVFMVVLDTTVVNLGLPSMRREYELDEGVEWVVTSYLAAVGVAQTTSGWLADRFGRRAMFIAALALFTAASLLCALSVSFEMLVAMRVVQGVGGGLMMPVAMAMIYELFAPDERGRALGYFGIAVMAAPAIGPVLGGGLVASLSWRWLFLINVPVGVVAVPLAIRLLRDTGYRESRPFDGVGLALSASGLGLFLVGISQGGIVGWGDPIVIGLVGVGVVLLFAFVVHARRAPSPLIDLTIFANRVFAIAMAGMALMAVAQFSRLVYIPLELGSLRGISELQIGVAMLPSALCMAATMPIGGRLVDRIGARIPVTVGVTILAVSFIGLWAVEIDTPVWVIALILALGGLGSGLAMMAPNIVAMNSLSAPQVSQGSGLSNVTRQVAAAIGVAALASIFATVQADDALGPRHPDALDPYRAVFLIAVGLLVVSLAVAQFLPGKQKALELQAERRREAESAGPAPEPVGHPAEFA